VLLDTSHCPVGVEFIRKFYSSTAVTFS